MTEFEELIRDRGVLATVAEESDRIAKLQGLEERVREERETLQAEESKISRSGLGSGEFEKLVGSITAGRVRVEQLERLCASLKEKRGERMRMIGDAKATFLKRRRDALAAELNQLNAAKSPHLEALKKLEGVEFAPLFESQYRGVLIEDGNSWHQVSRSFKLSRSIFELDQRLRALEESSVSQGESLYQQVVEARTSAPSSLLESAIGLFKGVS